MKNLTLNLVALLALSGFAAAQSTDDARPPRPPQEVVQQFDADGDGRLNETERQALRDSGQGRPSREQRLQRFDSDGDGQLNQTERNAAREARGQRGQCRSGGRRGGGGGGR